MWQIKAFIILAKLCRVGLTPGEPTLTDEGLDELDADLSFLVWKERQLVPSGELKRRDASGRTGEGVVCVLHPEELWLLEVRQCSLSTDLYNSLSLSLSIVSAWPRCTSCLASEVGWLSQLENLRAKTGRDKQIVGPHYLVLSSPGDCPMT